MFAEMVTNLVEKPGQRRAYPVGITNVDERDDARVASDHYDWAAQYDITEEKKHFVSIGCVCRQRPIQRGFLQSLFTADGQGTMAVKRMLCTAFFQSFITV
ncbi:MAG: hypothetical protein U0V48_01805 [Anaerolineales bacterium]